MIKEFQGEYRWLSNFTPVEVKFDGRIYPSTEHAYVAAKFWDDGMREIISRLDSAAKAKKFGQTYPIREDWDTVKVDIMNDLLWQKFNQEPFRTKLLETGSQTIIEGNWWHDNFWGICQCQKCAYIEGQNQLGFLIMQIRYELIQPSLFRRSIDFSI